jgi:hypothetical protein
MADPPRLTKLGAKWVEVRKRRDQGFRSGHDGGVLKRGQQHPFERSLTQASRGCPRLVGVASFVKGAAGVDQPFKSLSIFDC